MKDTFSIMIKLLISLKILTDLSVGVDLSVEVLSPLRGVAVVLIYIQSTPTATIVFKSTPDKKEN